MTVPTTSRLQSASLQQLAEIPAKELVVFQPLSVTLRGITDGSVAGSTNDAVFRFDSANDVLVGRAAATSAMSDGTGAPDMEVTHSATAGDSVTLRKRGKYKVTMKFHQAASSTCLLGISADVAAGGLTGNPSMGTSGNLEIGGAVLPAATSVFHTLVATVYVSEAEAKVGKVVRGHGTDGANAVVANATILNNTDCYLKVEYECDIVS